MGINIVSELDTLDTGHWTLDTGHWTLDMLTVVTPESLLICVHTVRWAPEMNQRQRATPAAAPAWAPLASTVQPDICQISFLSPLFPRNSDFPLGLAGGGAWLSVAAALVTSDQSAALPLSPFSDAVTKVCRMSRPCTWPRPCSKVTALKVLHHKSRWRQIWFLWWLPPPGNASTVHRARGFSPLIKCCELLHAANSERKIFT